MSDSSTRAQPREPPTRPKPASWVHYRAWLRAPGSDRVAVVLGLSLAIAVMYWPSVKALDGVWRGSAGVTYMDGYLLFLASLWLIVRDRSQLAECPLRPAPGACILAVTLSAAWVWSWRAVMQDPQLLLLPALWLTAIAAVLGWRAARLLAVPVGLLYFAMPTLGDLNGILQELSVRVSGLLIWVTGIPAYMHGDLIELPAGVIEIAGGCSGIDQFVVGLALGALYGEICRDSWRRRLTWLALMSALSLVCNWVRIFVITLVAYVSDMRASLVRHHIWFGWVLFLIAIIGFLWVAEAWNEAHPVEEHTSSAFEPPTQGRIRRPSVVATLICLAILPMLAYGVGMLRPSSAVDVAIGWPATPVGWNGPQPLLASDWKPYFVNPSAESGRAYVDSSGRTVEIFVVAYGAQQQGAKLLGYGNDLLGGAHRLQEQSQGVVDSATGRWRETVAVDAAGNRSLVWSGYLIGKRRFVRPRVWQLWYGLAALTGAPVSSLLALRAPCAPGCAGARTLLDAATTRMLPTLYMTKRIRGDTAP